MKLHENRCRQCKKLFCCVNCRLAHEKKKHSQREIKCPLCCEEKLQINGDESQEFICHLVFNHLPLLCRLCGQSFNSSQDLAILNKCDWWKTENSKKLLQILGNAIGQTTPSLEIKPSLNLCNKETVSHIRQSSDYVTFNSPPVLIRNTSTPMNVGISAPKANLEFKSLHSLSFFLKTPRNFSPSLEEVEPWPHFDKNELRRCSSDTQSHSGLYSHSRSSLQSSSFPQKLNNSSTNTTEYYSCEQVESDFGKRSLLMAKSEKLTKTDIENKKEIKESTKRVRFSDQFDHLSGMAEHDEFYEARENFSEISQKLLTNDDSPGNSVNFEESSADINANHENQMNVVKENKVCFEDNKDNLKENEICSKKNDVNFDNYERNELPIEEFASSNSGTFEKNSSAVKSPSSRVVMMVLVENATSLSRTKLAPLIDSGLKKLEETAASMNSVCSAISNCSPQKNTNETRVPGMRRSITSVNSYLSINSTECYSAQSGSQWNDSNESSSSINNESLKSDGIFSAVARVVRSALRKLPGTSSFRENSRESIIQESRLSTVASTSSLPTTSYNSLYSPPSGINHIPVKRSRDQVSPPSITSSSYQNEERSPIAKRSRGWYKIKAREPIARMRKVQVTSPKGVSSETQRFQQGSLSAGRQNTIIPLPSRAHQFTQTD